MTNVRFFSFAAHMRRKRSEWSLSADSVEKQRVAGAESRDLNGVRVPFLSGFRHLLRAQNELTELCESQ